MKYFILILMLFCSLVIAQDMPEIIELEDLGGQTSDLSTTSPELIESEDLGTQVSGPTATLSEQEVYTAPQEPTIAETTYKCWYRDNQYVDCGHLTEAEMANKCEVLVIDGEKVYPEILKLDENDDIICPAEIDTARQTTKEEAAAIMVAKKLVIQKLALAEALKVDIIMFNQGRTKADRELMAILFAPVMESLSMGQYDIAKDQIQGLTQDTITTTENINYAISKIDEILALE